LGNNKTYEVKTGPAEERAVLVGLVTQKQSEIQLEEYLDELSFLASTAGAIEIKRFWQKLPHPDNSTFVRKGKLEEIEEYVRHADIDIVIFDDEISPAQQRNLEKVLEIKVIDRSMLILDIFASRAQTAQAKTQVELAQTQYLLPRLKGMWDHLDRVKGGIGMRGAGEKEIETDRRIAQKKISLLKDELKKIETQNDLRRKNRGDLVRVSLVGYTNVGKSTLMHALSKSEVYVEDKLFATLDTTVRKVVIERTPFLLSDTVGFIRKLPHHLVESFKSTLDEVRESDLVLHVVDIAHPKFEDQMNTVEQTLTDLGAGGIQSLVVFNKMDLYRKRNFDKFLDQEVKSDLIEELKQTWMSKTNHNCVFISALNKENLNELRDTILMEVKKVYSTKYPYQTQFY